MPDPLVVSIAFNAHDSSVTIASGDSVLLVLEAERYYRVKRKRCDTPGEMEALVSHALSHLGLRAEDVTHWCGTAFENSFLPHNQRTCKWTAHLTLPIFGNNKTFYAVNHHLAHASLYYASGFDSALIKSCDGGGDGEKHVFYLAEGTIIRPLAPTDAVRRFNGTFYDVVSSYVYRVDGQEGTFMGLAGWGECDNHYYCFFDEHCDSICNDSYSDPYGLPTDGWRMLDQLNIKDLSTSTAAVRNFAKTAQLFFEHQQVLTLRDYAHLNRNLVLVGGSALNILANTYIKTQTSFDNVYIPPCCDDTGQSLGALLYFMNCQLGISPRVQFPFLGEGMVASRVNDACIERVVDDLTHNRVIAWHYGRGEIGPRALGHRSLLVSPALVQNRIYVSEVIKGREHYRPVAPIVRFEDQPRMFDSTEYSPYMTLSASATPLTCEIAPAVVHVDGTSRIQSIRRELDSALYDVLSAWTDRTGIPLLVNTSLNARGQPICATYRDTLAFAEQSPDMVVYLDGQRQ